MKLRGTIRIAAPSRAVWDMIVTPASLATCVPGVRDIRQVDERTFEGTISVAVGPMDGDFPFSAVLERTDYPDGLVVRLIGTDTVTRSRLEASIRAAVAPTDAPPAQPAGTELAYDAVVNVKGRLAILGEMVLRATASLMIDHATRCLRDRLEDAIPAPEVRA